VLCFLFSVGKIVDAESPTKQRFHFFVLHCCSHDNNSVFFMRKIRNLDSVLGRHPRRRLIGKEFLFFTLILLPTPIRVLNLSRYVFYPRAQLC
jgi:hypothetical protein